MGAPHGWPFPLFCAPLTCPAGSRRITAAARVRCTGLAGAYCRHTPFGCPNPYGACTPGRHICRLDATGCTHAGRAFPLAQAHGGRLAQASQRRIRCTNMARHPYFACLSTPVCCCCFPQGGGQHPQTCSRQDATGHSARLPALRGKPQPACGNPPHQHTGGILFI